MAGSLKEAAITTRAARAKLAPKSKPYWRILDSEVHIGYRRQARSGVWVVRWPIGGGNYAQTKVGTADDEISVGTLNYDQAVRRAIEIVEQRRLDEIAKSAGPIITVQGAVETYMDLRDQREAKRKGRPDAKSDARSRLTLHVLSSPLAKIELPKLTVADLTSWRSGLSGKASSQQRTVNDLRAALNAADTEGAIANVIRAGFKATAADDGDEIEVAREGQILTDKQVADLLAAARHVDTEGGWNGDFWRLVLMLTATGSRFSQVTRIRVTDFQPDRRRVLIPKSRKGKGKVGSTPVPLGPDVLEALAPMAEGRPGNAPLLERWRMKQSKGKVAVWERDRRGAWSSASEMIRPWQATIAKAKLPGVIPYALRHSSIVRGLRQNLPVRLVAALHDTSVAMLERHYSRWIADGLEDIAAKAIIPLVPEA